MAVRLMARARWSATTVVMCPTSRAPGSILCHLVSVLGSCILVPSRVKAQASPIGGPEPVDFGRSGAIVTPFPDVLRSTAVAETKLKADIRTSRGSAEARRLRRAGGVPANVYGREAEAKSVTVNARELYAVLHTEAGLNAVITLDVDGEKITTLAREVQRHPVRGDITHLDFIRISLTETVAAEVGIDFEGEPVGVRDDGGIVETIRAVVNVEALATDIPSSIALDISALTIGDVLRVSDLPVIDGVEYTDDPEASLVTVSVPAAIISEEAEEELLEGEEGEEGAEPGEEGAEPSASDEEGAEEASDE